MRKRSEGIGHIPGDKSLMAMLFDNAHTTSVYPFKKKLATSLYRKACQPLTAYGFIARSGSPNIEVS